MAAPAPRTEDIDLYCLNCGYNLRGLSGDPRRCPECGYFNPVGDLELPAPLITAQIRRMETAPAVCVASALCGTIFLILFVLETTQGVSGHEGMLLFFGLPALISAGVWVNSVSSFRASCLGKAGWGAALRRYHLYGLATALPLAVGLPALTILTMRDRTISWAISRALSLLLIGGMIGFLFFVGRWAQRRAVEDMQPLQREVAVTLARRRLREALARQPRGYSGGG